MRRVKNQSGFGLVEGLLILVIIAVLAASGLYVKNHRKTNLSSTASQTTAAAGADLKKIASDPAKQGTVTGVEAAISGSASDESQAEQQSENSQSTVAGSDHTDGNNLGGTVNENLINF